MCNHERMYEIEKMLDILDERIDKLSNRKTIGDMDEMMRRRVINSLLDKRAELEDELYRLEKTII